MGGPPKRLTVAGGRQAGLGAGRNHMERGFIRAGTRCRTSALAESQDVQTDGVSQLTRF
jgi:hypothetical protein